MKKLYFFLQSIDPTTNCYTNEVAFEVEEINELLNIANLEKAELLDGYYLGFDMANVIIDRFNVNFVVDDNPVRLRKWISYDQLTYKTHTGRELLMMLQEYKPLSVFSLDYEENFIEEMYFEPYVENGYLTKVEYYIQRLSKNRGDPFDYIERNILYARKCEEWRIDAYLMMINTAIEQGFDLGLERMQGALLGYTHQQNNEFMRFRALQIAKKNKISK